MDFATNAAIRVIVESLHQSGAIGDRNVREIIRALRDQRGTWGGLEDDDISSKLDALAQCIEHDLADNTELETNPKH